MEKTEYSRTALVLNQTTASIREVHLITTDCMGSTHIIMPDLSSYYPRDTSVPESVGGTCTDSVQ